MAGVAEAVSPTGHILVIFTRYPEPGRTKTRLIPALGADGAARLQEAMTGHTVLRARTWAAKRGAEIEVRHTGASAAAFRRWLGPDMRYVAQGDGDLGARMNRAIRDGLRDGASRVVLIGCDCPDIESRHLDESFAALAEHDVVVGPATDGGYYLIGMTQDHSALFGDLNWGSDSVLAETRRRARGLRLAELEPLHDIDEPADLEHWTRHTTPGTRQDISVIIPALNEETNISGSIQSALRGALDVIVADGGSTDRTSEIAKEAGARVVETSRGRAMQMNQGALSARGDILLFLHADTRLPDGYAEHIQQALGSDHVAGSAFTLAIDAQGRKYRAVEWGARHRAKYLSLPYGDQALSMRRDTFQRLGGYANLALMEDYDLVRRLRQRGRIVLLDQAVNTSARRWSRLGVFRTTLRNQLIVLGYRLGVKPEVLARWYRSQGTGTFFATR